MVDNDLDSNPRRQHLGANTMRAFSIRPPRQGARVEETSSTDVGHSTPELDETIEVSAHNELDDGEVLTSSPKHDTEPTTTAQTHNTWTTRRPGRSPTFEMCGRRLAAGGEGGGDVAGQRWRRE